MQILPGVAYRPQSGQRAAGVEQHPAEKQGPINQTKARQVELFVFPKHVWQVKRIAVQHHDPQQPEQAKADEQIVTFFLDKGPHQQPGFQAQEKQQVPDTVFSRLYRKRVILAGKYPGVQNQPGQAK